VQQQRQEWIQMKISLWVASRPPPLPPLWITLTLRCMYRMHRGFSPTSSAHI
jgi:hypothetical protein